jgi:cytochrome c oxidase cbb3-type subunit III
MKRLATTLGAVLTVGIGVLVAHVSRGAAQNAQRSAAQSTPPNGGGFVAHPDYMQAGLAQNGRWASLRNPFEGDRQRTAEGAKLFISYNCIDCHGADGSGAMGPSLADGRWHFGGSAGEVFQSIYEGRPDGMPSWGGRIADDQIWRLVAYVRSLSAGKDVSTENFTGKTIERTGH